MNLFFREKFLKKIKWDKFGLIPAIAQEINSKNILMLAWMNKEALIKTIYTKNAVYWSRSRKKIWIKGEKSGHFQKVHEIILDCDKDSILLKITQKKKTACHTGNYSCFFIRLL